MTTPDMAPATHRSFIIDQLEVRVFPSPYALAQEAAAIAQETLSAAIAERGEAAAILATGNSQIAFLEALRSRPGIDWRAVTLFHMDEYLGLAGDHPASFRRYMRERVAQAVKPRHFHYLAGDADLPISECRRYEGALRAQIIDLCCLGIGENGHLAFNDPPVARFDDPDWVTIVKLDQACRRQQVGEGHFPSLAAAPSHALTLTIPALCAARRMLAVVPEQRKAAAVAAALTGPIATSSPASHLRRQAHCTLFLDAAAASAL
jgi:glucosamine-6-phosphate deaminase